VYFSFIETRSIALYIISVLNEHRIVQLLDIISITLTC